MHIGLYMIGDEGWIGGVNYIQNLVKSLSCLPPTERGRFKLSLVADPSKKKFVAPVQDLVDDVFFESVTQRICRKNFCRWRLFPRIMADPFHLDFWYPNQSGLCLPYRNAGWIPDFQHKHLPHLFTPSELGARDKSFRAIAENCETVVLSSHMALDDFIRYFPERAHVARVLNFVSVPDPRCFSGNPIQIQNQYGLPDQFFLVSNQFWAHKNHEIVLDAMHILKQRGIAAHVACTGATQDHRNPGFFPKIVERVEALGLENHFKILGLIPRHDQMQLMRRCLAVLQPSLFEGWSTVVEDAKGVGKRILLSDFPVHVEQDPPCAQFYSGKDPFQLADLMEETLASQMPGPDLQKEELARQKNSGAMVAYARGFLDVAFGVDWGGQGNSRPS